ncbi:hypothetical protein VHEMI07229 [[Torrubiella] hemipterigena]|uniref:BRCT domain-containing protein n=1 Tax=[Torrubiella] hemipterigena TaxID=1531966 RepID=A0A0A1T2U4_9HYPO|nr:hypothetical protein VHEMI07229 [[Torrubiella] hemipterigena]
MADSPVLYVLSAFVANGSKYPSGLQQPQLYSTKAAANAAGRQLLASVVEQLGDDNLTETHRKGKNGLYQGHCAKSGAKKHDVTVSVFEAVVDPGSAAEDGAKAKQHIKKELEEDEDGEDEDGEDHDEDEPEEEKEDTTKVKVESGKRSKTAIGRTSTSRALDAVKKTGHRKTIPKGIPGCLEGVKILFTGTFETMDRNTSIATAKKYGADVVTKLEDTDYIVLGFRAGPKKLETINELELETITEQQFFDILEGGLSEEKKERMANKRKADEEEEPEGHKAKKTATPRRAKK